MALIFPFDESLNGHLELVTIKTTDLTFPIFTFPKGSFFVNQTYAIIKGTNKLLRPGIDYRVLSCNQNIPFSSDKALDNKLKSHYVRNAILLTLDTPLELEWHVAYSGGEETTKPAEYVNFLNSMLNTANLNATYNQFTTKHQGWGVFVSPNNTQIMQGKYIYSDAFAQDAERLEGDFGGLGWGKVELALHSIADVVASGNDPLILEAFFNWVEHNEIEFNKVKNNTTIELNQDIKNLDNKRVDVEQFIYTDSGITPANQKFIKHNNLILRGIDPNSTVVQTGNPTAVMRKGVGFYSLATQGNSINNLPTKLLQRKPSDYIDTRQGVELTFSKSIYSQNSDAIRINIKIDRTNVSTTKAYTLYVVSRELGLISNTDITTQMRTLNTTFINVTYPNTPQNFSSDSLFAYVLDESLQYTNSVVAKADIVITSLAYGYKLSINNHNALVTGTGINNVTEAAVNGGFEVIINRNYATAAETLTLKFLWGNNQAVKFNGNLTSINVSFAAGENTKRIFVRPTFDVIVEPYINCVLTRGALTVDTVSVGVASSQKQTQAYISVHGSELGLDHLWNMVTKTGSYLKVRFSKDTMFNGSDFTVAVTNYNNQLVTVDLLDGIQLDSSTIIYPLVITGTANSLFGINLVGFTGNAISNRVNLAINPDDSISSNAATFKSTIRGINLTQRWDGNKWRLLFDLEFNGVISDNSIFEVIGSTVTDLVLPEYAMSRNNKLMFSANAPRFINEAFSVSVNLAGMELTASFDISNVMWPVAFDDLRYSDGVVTEAVIELNKPFKLMVTNPYVDRVLTFNLDNYPSGLGLNDIVINSLNAGVTNTTAAPYLSTVVLQPNETKQLNKDEWISIAAINSSYPGTQNAELGVAGLYCPPYRVTSTKLDGTVISNNDYTAIATYKVLDAVKVISTNRVYGIPIYNLADAFNVIDITISNVDLTDVATVSVNNDQGAFNATLQNIVVDKVNRIAVVSIELTYIKGSEITDDNKSLNIELNNSSGATLLILESSLRIVNDV